MEEKDNTPREGWLYSFKNALEQPIWIQKFTEHFSLNNPVRFSVLAYFMISFGLLYFTVGHLLLFLPKGLRLVLFGFLSYLIGITFSDFKPDGKSFPLFIFDYVKNYIFVSCKKGYFYKGVYVKGFDKDEEGEE